MFSTSVFAEGENVIECQKWFIPENQINDAPFMSRSISYSRQRLEQELAQLARRSATQGDQQPYLSQIVLKARLEGRQLTSGHGTFALHPRTETVHSILLNPFTLAVSSPRWADDTDAILFSEPDGGNRLLIPSETDSDSYDQLQFRWSLQSRRDLRNGIVFDLALPPCLSIELQLELPESMVLTTSEGLVIPDERGREVGQTSPESAFSESALRTWRVLLGHHSSTTLMITPDKALSSVRTKPTIRQITNYIITSQGLETLVRVMFDRADPRPAELHLALEMPLRPVEVRYGDRPVVWTRTPLSTDVTEVRVDLSPFADEEPQDQELTIRSLGPLRENQRWVLPRVRVASPDIFWLETRASVSVASALRTRNIICHRAVQVPPRPTTVVDWAERELFVFQFFQDDAQIELEAVYSIPHVTVNSAAQVTWNDSEIRSTLYLDCSVTEGDRFTLNFPISEHWVIDSVTSYPSVGALSTGGDTNISWNMLDDTQPRTLSIQLNRPLRPRQPVTLQINSRFVSTQSQFRLAELSPLVLSRQHGETHRIATQLDFINRQVKPKTDASVFSISRMAVIGGNAIPLLGDVYPLDYRTQDIRFELEQMRPNYTAEISGNIYIENNELSPRFQILCTPMESSVSRVFVHFSPTGQDSPGQWEWSVGDSRPHQVSKSTPEELKALLPLSEQQHWNEELERGEIWEIRFDELRTEPFLLSAVSVMPLADSIAIPFASVPLASTQKGELTIESPQQFDYRLTGARLDSIPIAPAAWDRYQSIRTAFRYNPLEEQHRSQYTPLMLQRLSPDEQSNTAWVWSLQLDSQHAPEGVVQNRALFLVENQGKDALQITLPHAIDVTHVFAVWRDSQQISWLPSEDRQTIDIALPVGQRFVSIVIEYTCQDLPLVRQRKLRPHYPTVNVPVLSGSWTSWFPPEFDVSLQHTTGKTEQSANPLTLSKSIEYLLSHTYRSFLGSMWSDVLYGEQRRQEAETAAQYFFAEIAHTFQNNSIATWGDLIGNEGILPAVRARLASDDTSRVIVSSLLLDKQALAFLDITPATPVDVVGTVNEENVREKLFAEAGLVLLIATQTRADGIRDYLFMITTPSTLSLNQYKPLPAGHCVRAVPYEVSQSPQWIRDFDWLSATTLSSIPWAISTQVMQRMVFTSGWNAHSLPLNSEQSFHIVHHQKFLALQWLAFLFVVLITSRKPLAHPLALLALLVIFEVIARLVAPCYVGIPSGAFLGVLVSLAFVLIRSQINPQPPRPDHATTHDSTECTVSFVQTPLLSRSILLCGLLTIFSGLSTMVSAQILPELIQNPPRKEPHRIFYPTDAEGRVVGENVWVPAEFLVLLHQHIQADDSAKLPRWNITKATYQGSLTRSASGSLECSDDFKVVYDIYLDAPSIMITLPKLPAVQGKFFWNSRPIQPIWDDNEQSETIAFAISNEVPGRHTLEIGLSPKAALQSDGESFRIAFAIPKVPSSTLRLNVPLDAPPVNVPDALGGVTANTAQSPVVIAELGPAQQLSLSWTDDQNATFVREVEQFFRIRISPWRIEIETLFRFQIEGGSVQHVTIQTDPRWTLLGQFRCQHPIVSNPIASRPETNSDIRIDFQSPVSGTVTLEGVFGWRENYYGVGFYGVGNLRLPKFSALKVPIARSMLAVYADPMLELDLPIEGRSSGFESGWQGTVLPRPTAVSPDAEYDLTQTPPDWMLNIRIKKSTPDVAVSQSVQLDACESQVRVVGEFTAKSAVFQQHFSADHPLRIEALEVHDSQGAVVESRWQHITSETMPKYLVFFKRPVTGQYTMTVRGFFATETREEISLRTVPLISFGEAQMTDHSLNLFRTSAVIAEIPAEQSGWARTSVLPTALDSFSQSIPLGTWQKTETTESEPGALQFALTPNRPNVKCSTNLSLHVNDDEQWTMTLNFNGNITGGELRALQFQWDERCGVIPPIESATSWSISSLGGQQVLEVFLNEPIRGDQHIKFVVPLNVTGAVSFPNVFPLPGIADQFESELFVELPLRLGNEIIPWDLNQLVETEEQASDVHRAVFRALDSNFTAAINRDEAKLTAIFYDTGFLVKQDGSVFGIATIDLNNQGQDSLILQMPEGYEPIQISSGGLMVGRTRLPDNRWQINIGTSDYPQRFSILFRASLSQPLNRWNREKIVSTLEFPFLEGVTVQESLWTITFEGILPSLNVTIIQDHFFTASKEYDLGNHVPLVGIDAALSLIGINFVRQNNLFHVLRSLPVSGRQEEMQRWFSHWSDEWQMVSDKVDFQIAHLPLTLHNVQPRFIARQVDAASVGTESAGIVRPFVEMMGVRTQESLRVSKEQTVREKFGTAMDTVAKQSAPILNSQVYWQGRVAEDVRYLFGAEEGALRSISLTSMPSTGGWMLHFSEHVWLWVGLSLSLPIVVLLLVRWVYLSELWLQFPHFWGMTFGVLLWVFFPESFIGLIIIVLTFISFFRPSWTRHRFRGYP